MYKYNNKEMGSILYFLKNNKGVPIMNTTKYGNRNTIAALFVLKILRKNFPPITSRSNIPNRENSEKLMLYKDGSQTINLPILVGGTIWPVYL